MSKRPASRLRRWLDRLPAAASLTLLAACAAAPGNENGQCRLDCSKPRVAGTEFTVEPLFPVNLSIGCEGNPGDQISLETPVPIEYRIYQTATPFLGQSSGGTGGGTGGTGGSADPSNDLPLPDPTNGASQGEEIIPAGGIGFQPVIISTFMDTPRTNPEFQVPDGKGGIAVNPSDYNGVATSSAEFCSDSCGVMKFEIWPLCIVGLPTTVTAGIAVGSIKATSFVSFSVGQQ